MNTSSLRCNPFDPRILRADAFTNIPQGFQFLQKRGFYEAFRETPVRIDTTSFNPSPYADLETELLEKGIVIKTLREMESDPNRDQKIYQLYWEAFEDVPQEGLDVEVQTFDTWVKWALNDPSVLHDAYFIAVHGDEYVGFRELGRDPDNMCCWVGYSVYDGLIAGRELVLQCRCAVLFMPKNMVIRSLKPALRSKMIRCRQFSIS